MPNKILFRIFHLYFCLKKNLDKFNMFLFYYDFLSGYVCFKFIHSFIHTIDNIFDSFIVLLYCSRTHARVCVSCIFLSINLIKHAINFSFRRKKCNDSIKYWILYFFFFKYKRTYRNVYEQQETLSLTVSNKKKRKQVSFMFIFTPNCTYRTVYSIQ